MTAGGHNHPSHTQDKIRILRALRPLKVQIVQTVIIMIAPDQKGFASGIKGGAQMPAAYAVPCHLTGTHNRMDHAGRDAHFNQTRQIRAFAFAGIGENNQCFSGIMQMVQCVDNAIIEGAAIVQYAELVEKIRIEPVKRGAQPCNIAW